MLTLSQRKENGKERGQDRRWRRKASGRWASYSHLGEGLEETVLPPQWSPALQPQGMPGESGITYEQLYTTVWWSYPANPTRQHQAVLENHLVCTTWELVSTTWDLGELWTPAKGRINLCRKRKPVLTSAQAWGIIPFSCRKEFQKEVKKRNKILSFRGIHLEKCDRRPREG